MRLVGMGRSFSWLAFQRLPAARARFLAIIAWPPKKVTRATLSLPEVFHRIGQKFEPVNTVPVDLLKTRIFRTAAFAAAAVFFTAAAPVGFGSGGVSLAPHYAAPVAIDRGELLLGELNCVACHQASQAVRQRLDSRQAPHLGSNGLRLTPQFIRAYLADPQAVKPGAVMPHLLHDIPEPERGSTIESITHFLISQQSSDEPTPTGAIEGLVHRGEALYHSVGCVACHAPAVPPKGESAVPALADSIPLSAMDSKTTVEDLARFLINPAAARPSGRMPSSSLSPQEAKALAMWLLRGQAPPKDSPDEELVPGLEYQYFEGNFPGTPDFDSLSPVSVGVAGGFELQSRRRENGFGYRFSGNLRVPKDGRYVFFTNSDDGSMLYIDGALVVNNAGDHAPTEKRGAVQLKEGTHSIVVTYFNNGGGFELQVAWQGPGIRKQEIPSELLSHSGRAMRPTGGSPFTLDPAKVAQGKGLFTTMGCAACHQVSGAPRIAHAARDFKALPSVGGCLEAQPRLGLPQYSLSDVDRGALKKAVAKFQQPLPALGDSDKLRHSMARLNCYACHSRAGEGGAAAERLAYFDVAGGEDLGDEGRIPPHLTAVGSKLETGWIQTVLEGKGGVRPYMATRMPVFAPSATAQLPGLFEKVDLPANPIAEPTVGAAEAKFGRKLVGVSGLTCVSCHTFGKYKSLGIPAVDLTTMGHRLRYDWLRRYLVEPSALRPGTRMPTFWPGGQAANRDILGGDTDRQIQAIWAYLKQGDKADIPDGLIQGRKEIVASGEAVIYRNFIQGGGSRAIGVGYPEKANLCFDANDIRLAMIWQGAFIDAERHSSGRGEGYEPPLGHNVVKLPAGPAFALLDSPDAAWPSQSGRAGGYSMKGYTLDPERRPAFTYQFNGVEIQDYPVAKAGELDASLTRAVTLSAANPPANLWFRAAVGKIEQKGSRYFVVDDRLNLKFDGDSIQEARVREVDGQMELLIKLKFEQGKAAFSEEFVW